MGVSIVSAMGVCLGSQIKAEGLINFGTHILKHQDRLVNYICTLVICNMQLM
jgi:hypothetical protein